MPPTAAIDATLDRALDPEGQTTEAATKFGLN